MTKQRKHKWVAYVALSLFLIVYFVYLNLYGFNVRQIKMCKYVCLVLFDDGKMRFDNWSSFTPEMTWTLLIEQTNSDGKKEQSVVKDVRYGKIPFGSHTASCSKGRIIKILDLTVTEDWPIYRREHPDEFKVDKKS